MGKSKYSEKNLSHCHFVYHKSHMGWFGIDLEPVIVSGVAQSTGVFKEHQVSIYCDQEAYFYLNKKNKNSL
jgi:hypothetical protein